MMGLHIWRKVCFASSQNNQITKNDWTLLVCTDQHGPEGQRDGFCDIGLEMVWEGQREARNPRPLLRSCALGFFSQQLTFTLLLCRLYFPGWFFICLLYCCISLTCALGCISRSVARSATWIPLDLNHLSWLRSLLLDGRLQAAVKKMLRFYQWIWGRRDAVFCLSWSFVIGQI